MDIVPIHAEKMDDGTYTISNLESWQLEIIRSALKTLNGQRIAARKYVAKKRNTSEDLTAAKNLKPMLELKYTIEL
jgi:hypothetical protein